MRRGLVTAAAMLIAGGTMAQAPSPPPPPTLALDHVGIQASDLGRSVTFYTQVLGLREVPAPFPRTAGRWIALDGGRMLHIVANGRPGAPHNRWDHFALACADLDGVIARLDALRVPWAHMDGRPAPQTRPDGVRQIFVRDPDGYVIEINDAAAHRNAQR